MKNIFIVFIIAVLTGQSSAQTFECRTGDVDEIGWLAGLWQSETVKGKTSFERWTRRDDATWMGTAFRVTGKDTVVLENVSIQRLANCIIYLAAPRGQRPTAFTLVDTTGGDWIFENPEHDFPTRVVYSRPTGNVLNARIEGTIDAKPKVIPFVYRRSQTP